MHARIGLSQCCKRATPARAGEERERRRPSAFAAMRRAERTEANGSSSKQRAKHAATRVSHFHGRARQQRANVKCGACASPAAARQSAQTATSRGCTAHACSAASRAHTRSPRALRATARPRCHTPPSPHEPARGATGRTRSPSTHRRAPAPRSPRNPRATSQPRRPLTPAKRPRRREIEARAVQVALRTPWSIVRRNPSQRSHASRGATRAARHARGQMVPLPLRQRRGPWPTY
jgi:hypothetical protein